jgi:hypothetical protein
MRPRYEKWLERGAAAFSVVLATLGTLAPFGSALGSVGPSLGRPTGRTPHERFEPDPAEELPLHSTTENGRLSGAINTSVGPVGAPSAVDGPAPPEAIFGGSTEAAGPSATFKLDGATLPPEMVRYYEPFRPGTAPFKRLYAYDFVKSDFSLGVQQPALTGVPMHGSVTAKDEAFYSEFYVELKAGVPVRVASVAPGARIVALYSEPDRDLEMLEDGAENWFVRGKTTERVRIVMQIAAPKRAFSLRARLGNFRTIESREPVPLHILEAAGPVLLHIGVDRTLAPSVALERLVAYFRNFRPSAVTPLAQDPIALYRELSLNQRGVCRHRAFAFHVTAQALGFRTRVVTNEAHAWVEVFDGEGYARIDLGGAAPNVMQVNRHPEVPLHEPEPDPFTWPLGQVSGQQLGREMHGAPSSPKATGTWPGSVESTAPSGPRAPGASSSEASPSSRPTVVLGLKSARARRGELLLVEGSASQSGQPCARKRVDVFLGRADGGRELVGSVLTDAQGQFTGQVSLPRDLPLGHALVSAQIAGACGLTP